MNVIEVGVSFIIVFTLFLGNPLSFHVSLSRHAFCEGHLYCWGMYSIALGNYAAAANCENLYVQKALSVTVVCLWPVLRIYTYFHNFLSSDLLISGKTTGCTVL